MERRGRPGPVASRSAIQLPIPGSLGRPAWWRSLLSLQHTSLCEPRLYRATSLCHSGLRTGGPQWLLASSAAGSWLAFRRRTLGPSLSTCGSAAGNRPRMAPWGSLAPGHRGLSSAAWQLGGPRRTGSNWWGRLAAGNDSPRWFGAVAHRSAAAVNAGTAGTNSGEFGSTGTPATTASGSALIRN